MERLPLVLIPGLLCDALLFQHQIAMLAPFADCWVPACRGSESIADMAKTILDECPFPRFSAAGLSMGGYVAFELHRIATERITGLALLDTTARPDTAEQTDRRLRLMEIAKAGRFGTVAEMLAPALINGARLDDSALRGIIRTMAYNTGIDAFLNQERAIIGRADSRPMLQTVTSPTVVICGSQDAITPPDRHEEIASGIPHAQLHIIDDCGHLSTLEQPEAVGVLMRKWLLDRATTV